MIVARAAPRRTHSLDQFVGRAVDARSSASRSCRLQQFGRLGAGFVGDGGARQHARDFLAALGGAQLADAGARDRAVVGFFDPVMMRRARRDLRASG